jgi:hypothetical protein
MRYLGRPTMRYLGRPTVRYLRTLSDITSTRSLVTRGTFLASAHRELGVALVQSRGDEYRSCALFLGFRAAAVAWGGHSLP